jgi:uncharacterized membrane protein YdjX (TVP38/TMEM64 family)
VPGPLFSYALGLTNITAATLVSATLIGKAIPITVWVLVGAAGRDAISGSGIPQIQLALLCAAVVTTTVATILVAPRARALLRIQNATQDE